MQVVILQVYAGHNSAARGARHNEVSLPPSDIAEKADVVAEHASHSRGSLLMFAPNYGRMSILKDAAHGMLPRFWVTTVHFPVAAS